MRKSLIPVAVLLAAALTLGGCGEKASNIGRDTGGEASSSVAETTVDGTAGDGGTAREAAGNGRNRPIISRLRFRIAKMKQQF